MATQNDHTILEYWLRSDPISELGNIFTFKFNKAVVILRVIFYHEDSGADMAITNITTIPEKERKNGYGSCALQFLINKVKGHGLSDIWAAKVKRGDSERFWLKNGFVKLHNETNDYRLS